MQELRSSGASILLSNKPQAGPDWFAVETRSQGKQVRYFAKIEGIALENISFNKLQEIQIFTKAALDASIEILETGAERTVEFERLDANGVHYHSTQDPDISCKPLAYEALPSLVRRIKQVIPFYLSSFANTIEATLSKAKKIASVHLHVSEEDSVWNQLLGSSTRAREAPAGEVPVLEEMGNNLEAKEAKKRKITQEAEQQTLLSKNREAWMKKVAGVRGFSLSVDQLRALLDEGEALGCLNEINKDLATSAILHMLMKMPRKNEILDLIAEYDFDFSVQDNMGNTPLLWAIANACNGNAMWMIMQGGQNINGYLDVHDHYQKNNTALHLAIAKGYKTKSRDGKQLPYSNLQLVQAMIAQGVDVNSRNFDGNTPLHLACMRRDPGMIRALVDAGADLSIQNALGMTPEECLNMDFETVNNVMSATAVLYELNLIEFEENLQAARKALLG